MQETAIDRHVLHVAEHLLRAQKRRVLAPINAKLARAVASRFRSQAAAVKKELAPLLKRSLQEADRPVPPGLLAATAAAMAQRRAISGYSTLTRRAYQGGSAITSGELDSDAPERIPGPGRTSEDVEGDLDSTTSDRLETALRTAFEEGLTAAGALALVAGVFQGRVDGAAGIAEHEVSNAFHQGQTDTARAISTDIGEDVEKRWDCEPGACEECLECQDEDWVDIDFEYPNFGVDDPPGHNNCVCGLSFRRAKSEED